MNALAVQPTLPPAPPFRRLRWPTIFWRLFWRRRLKLQRPLSREEWDYLDFGNVALWFDLVFYELDLWFRQIHLKQSFWIFQWHVHSQSDLLEHPSYKKVEKLLSNIHHLVQLWESNGALNYAQRDFYMRQRAYVAYQIALIHVEIQNRPRTGLEMILQFFDAVAMKLLEHLPPLGAKLLDRLGSIKVGRMIIDASGLFATKVYTYNVYGQLTMDNRNSRGTRG
jgi:hypothetical protein